jgi:outer membrane protein TolC
MKRKNKNNSTWIKPFFTIVYLFLSASILYSQDSLSYYIEIAAKNNPGLKASLNQYIASLEKIHQVGSLPDPQVTFGYFIRPMELIMGKQVADITLMQMFPWFGSLPAAKSEASLMARARYESFRDAKLNLFYAVKSAFYRLYKLQKEIKISEDNLEILKSYEQLTLSRFKSGAQDSYSNTGTSQSSALSGISNEPKDQNMNANAQSSGKMGSMPSSSNTGINVTPDIAMSTASAMNSSTGGSDMSDLLLIRMNIYELENSIALLNDKLALLQAEFNAYLNRPANATVSVVDTLNEDSLSIPVLNFRDSIMQNNPSLRMLDAEISSYDAKTRMANRMGYPMVGLGLNYMLIEKNPDNTSMMNGRDMVMPMISVSLPIYRKKYKSAEREAQLLQQSTVDQKTDAINQIMVSYQNTLVELNDAQRRIKLYQDEAELADRTIELLVKEYSLSIKNLNEVLRMQQTLLDYRLKLIQAIVDQKTAIALLQTLADNTETVKP